jgi:hypothetical protein
VPSDPTLREGSGSFFDNLFRKIIIRAMVRFAIPTGIDCQQDVESPKAGRIVRRQHEFDRPFGRERKIG